MVSSERFNSDKSGTDIRVTGFFKRKSNIQILDLQGFTATKQASFNDLQGFSRVKPGPNFQFTGFLRSQAKPPFFGLQGFYRVKPGPLLRFTGFYSVKRVLLFSDSKRFFTCYLHNLASNIYRFFTKKIL